MPTRRYFANNAPQQTLANSITSGATSCQISGSFSGWPTQFPFYAALDLGAAAFEIVSVTNIVGTTATIARAQDGTVAVAHPAGATLNQVVVRQDFDEANAHTSSSAGVHGVTGSVVGTTDVQTLTNKTLTSPQESTSTVTSASSTPALVVQNNNSTTPRPAISVRDNTSTQKMSVDGTTGNVTTSGSITATGGITSSSTISTTGIVQGGSIQAGTNGTVSGVLVPTSYTNEAAATAALPTPPTYTQVWLTAPTGGAPAGPYSWNGTAWAPVRTWSGGDTGQLGSSAALATVGVTVATPGSVTVTLPAASVVRIDAVAQFQMASGTTGRYYVRPAYNTGSSVVIGSAVGVGFFATTMVTVVGTNGMTSATAFGQVALAAGTYTFYGLLARAAGGGATDFAQSSEVMVTVIPS